MTASEKRVSPFRITESPTSLELPSSLREWRSLTVENVGSSPVVSPEVMCSGQLDLSEPDAIIAHVIEEGMTDAEQAMALFQFVKSTVCKWALPNLEGNARPMQILNVYGYCNCGGFARTLAMLAGFAGLEARVVGLHGHVVTEIFYAGSWHAFDANLQVVYRKPDGTLASVDEVHRNPQLLSTADHDFHAPDSFNLPGVRKMYEKGQFSYSPPPGRDEWRGMGYVLHPEERLEWFRDERATFFPYQNDVFMCTPPPGYYASGTMTYRPDLAAAGFVERWQLGSRDDDVELRDGTLSVCRAGRVQRLVMRWGFPWAVLGGRIRLSGFRTPGDGVLRARLMRPDKTVDFDGILTEREDRQGEFRAVLDFTRAAVLPSPSQVLFDVALELTMYKVRAESRLLLCGLSVEVDLQRSPQSLPPAAFGGGRVLYRDRSDARALNVWVEASRELTCPGNTEDT